MMFADDVSAGTAGVWAALVASLVANGIGAYTTFRKGKAAADREESQVSNEDQERAIDQWRDYAKSMSREHGAAIAKLEGRLNAADARIADLSDKERQCQIDRAKQEAEILHLKEQIIEFREEFQRQLDAKSPRSGG